MKPQFVLALLCAIVIAPATAQMGPSRSRPPSLFEYMFPATAGRTDLMLAAREGGLYGAYGILGAGPQVATHPRVQGPLRMLGGGMEMLGGGYLTAQTGGVGGVLGGGALALNGLDNFQAGLRMTTTGQYQQAVIEQALTDQLGPGWGTGVYAVTQFGMAGVPWAAARIPNIPRLESGVLNPGNYRFPRGAFYSGVPFPEYIGGQRVMMVDPALLRLPTTRSIGANPLKLASQIQRYGATINGMPPIELTLGMNGQMMINDGVTRATRMMTLNPGQLMPAIITETYPGMNLWSRPRLGGF